MAGYIKRDIYLNKLINRMNNGEVKVITGPRRCGKSWLLCRIFRDYLLSIGVEEKNIIIVSFDTDCIIAEIRGIFIVIAGCSPFLNLTRGVFKLTLDGILFSSE